MTLRQATKKVELDKRYIHRQSIRKRELTQRQTKLREETRMKIESYVPEDLPIQKLSQLFSNLSISEQPQHPHTLQDLVSMFPQFKDRISEPSNSQDSISLMIFLEKLFSENSAACSEEMLCYLNNFIAENDYEKTVEFYHFSRAFLKVLEHVTGVPQRRIDKFGKTKLWLFNKLKADLLKWCQGSKALKIIYNCLDKYLSVTEYFHIYQILYHTLTAQTQTQSHLSMQALLIILSKASPEDIQQILQYYTQIYIYFVDKSFKLQDAKHCDYIEVVLQFSRSKAIVQLARAGLLDLITKLFEPERERYVDRLKLFKQLVDVGKQEMGRLLKSVEMHQIWQKISSLYCSSNNEEVFLVYSILHGYWKLYDEELITWIYVELDRTNRLYPILESALNRLEDESGILVKGVQILRKMLYNLREGNSLGMWVIKEIVKREFLEKIEIVYYKGSKDVSRLAGEILGLVEMVGIEEIKEQLELGKEKKS